MSLVSLHPTHIEMNQSTSTVPPEVSAGQLVFQVASSYMASAALQVAMRLGIAGRLSNGPRPVADLAREAGVQTDGLYRVLRAPCQSGYFCGVLAPHVCIDPRS